mgnify:CR=1 FL=1
MKKEKYYLVDDNTGWRKGKVYIGTKEEALQEALNDAGVDLYLRGDHVAEISVDCKKSYRLQTVKEYEGQEKERDEKRGLITKIESVVDMADEMKNAYFWSNDYNKTYRDKYDQNHSVPEVCWEEGGHTYSAEFCTRSSRQNVYAKGHYYKDGVETNLKAIRNSLKRMWDSYNKQYKLGDYANLPEMTPEEKEVVDKRWLMSRCVRHGYSDYPHSYDDRPVTDFEIAFRKRREGENFEDRFERMKEELAKQDEKLKALVEKQRAEKKVEEKPEKKKHRSRSL